jgi:hypothetical protein
VPGEKDRRTPSLSVTIEPMPTERYVNLPPGPVLHKYAESTRYHLFYVQSAHLMAKPYWPLANYWVYLDTGVWDAIYFDELGLLWTDETGCLHYTGADGRPTRRVTHIPFAYSSYMKDSGIQSATLVYGESVDRVKTLKNQVEAAGKGSELARKYEVREKQLVGFTDEKFNSWHWIIAPRDDEVLPLEKLESFVQEADKYLKTAQEAQQAVVRVATENDEVRMIAFYREQINRWLDADPERRQRLEKINPSTTIWDAACHNFDWDWHKALLAYENALDPLFDILTNPDRRADLGMVGLVVDGWDTESGEHLLWRHQFLTEACGLFSGTWRHKDVFDQCVEPLARGLATPFTMLRVKCSCPTCMFFRENITASADQPPEDPLPHVGWKSKDLKLVPRTGARLIDLFTKFAPNFAYLAYKQISQVYGMGWDFFYRTGIVDPIHDSFDELPKMAKAWQSLFHRVVEGAAHAEGSLEQRLEETDNFLTRVIKDKALLGKAGNYVNLVGAGVAILVVYTKEGKVNVKDAMDVSRAITDAARAGIGLNKERFEAALVEQLGKDVGMKWAKMLPKYISFAGGVFQVASSWVSLRDAAEKGDKREFVWYAVSYFGADVAMAGLTLDVAPEAVVTKGSGLVLNFIGGVIYLVGGVGEFCTRLGSEEQFLYDHSFYRHRPFFDD